MSENISDLLVGLSLDTDEQSFQQGMSAFNGIRSAALSAAGAIGLGFGATSFVDFTRGLAEANVEAQRLDTTVGTLTQLDDAFRMAGASGAEATAELGRMAQLLDAFRFQPGGSDFSLAQIVGLDPRGIADAENVMDAYQRLIQQTSQMDAQERRVALGSLGFGEGTEALAQAGPDRMQEWMAQSARLAGVTDEMVQQSIEFNRELSELNTGLRGLSQAIMMELVPTIRPLIETINNFLGEEDNRADIAELISKGPIQYLIDNGIFSDGGGVRDWFENRETPMTQDGQGAPSGTAEWSGDLFRGAPDRGADSWIPDIWPETLDAIREMQNGPEAIGGPSEPMPRELDAGTLDAIRERQERGEFRASDMEYLREQMRQEFPEQYQGNVTFNINGATDPRETARIIDERMRQLSRRTADDYRTPLV